LPVKKNVYGAVRPECGTRPLPGQQPRGAAPGHTSTSTIWDAASQGPNHRSWVKKIEQGDGKVCVGFFHLWVVNRNGERLRRRKEKVLGAAAMPKHEALKKFAALHPSVHACGAGPDHCDPDVHRSMADFLQPEIGPVVSTLPGNDSIRSCEPRTARHWQATSG
jgi:hypothetical protein